MRGKEPPPFRGTRSLASSVSRARGLEDRHVRLPVMIERAITATGLLRVLGHGAFGGGMNPFAQSIERVPSGPARQRIVPWVRAGRPVRSVTWNLIPLLGARLSLAPG